MLEGLREHNRGRLSPQDLTTLERRAARFLNAAGTERRFRLAIGERALDLAVSAARSALQESALTPGAIDFLIYAGVGRGWIEPATATALQAELGLSNATSFDVLDACAGWLRALEVANAYIGTRQYRRGLIVTCECGLYNAFAGWTVGSLAELDYKLAMYTIGEAATATVVTDESSGDVYFRFRTFPDHFRLCMIPSSGFADFWPGDVDPRYEPERFFALSRDLLAIGARRVVEVFEADPVLRNGTYDIWFGHAPSEKLCRVLAGKLGAKDAFVSTHRQFGNTVSAAVPLGMSVALRDGRFQRGQRAIAVVGSAGITVGFAAFTF